MMANDQIPVFLIIHQKDSRHNKTSPLEYRACFIVLYYNIFILSLFLIIQY